MPEDIRIEDFETIAQAAEYIGGLYAKRAAENPEYTKGELALEMGLGGNKESASATFSGILSGKVSSPDRQIEKVNRYRRLEVSRRLMPELPKFADTSVSRRVLNQIVYAHTFGELTVTFGDAGIGKTSAVEEYAKQNGDLAVVLKCYPNITNILRNVAKATGVTCKSQGSLRDALIEYFSGSSKVIIVDEGQFLSVPCLEDLRTLAEDSGVGLALIGNHTLYTRMKGIYAQKHDQLDSRAIFKEVRRKQVKKTDVKKIFEQYDLDAKTLDMLYTISTETNKGLRGAVKIVMYTLRKFGREATAEHYAEIKAELLTA